MNCNNALLAGGIVGIFLGYLVGYLVGWLMGSSHSKKESAFIINNFLVEKMSEIRDLRKGKD